MITDQIHRQIAETTIPPMFEASRFAADPVCGGRPEPQNAAKQGHGLLKFGLASEPLQRDHRLENPSWIRGSDDIRQYAFPTPHISRNIVGDWCQFLFSGGKQHVPCQPCQLDLRKRRCPEYAQPSPVRCP